MPLNDHNIRWGTIALLILTLLSVEALTYLTVRTQDVVNRNRETTCIAVFNNPASTARHDDTFLDLCAEVGISP